MNEKPEFIGRRYSEEEKAEAEQTLRVWSKEGSKPIEGEIEKTEEDIKMIGAINDFIADELQSLGIEDYQPLPPERVHILPGEILRQKFPNSTFSAGYHPGTDAEYVDKDQAGTKADLFSSMLHESIHRAQTQKFYEDAENHLYGARIGYHTQSPWKNNNREHQLWTFNEVITDWTVYTIMMKNQDKLLKEFGISDEDTQGPLYTYARYIPILGLITHKIAQDKNISRDKVSNDLKRGQFQKNILVLKDVERSFGRGALRVLSLLRSLDSEEDNDKVQEMVEQFFAEGDESEREKIKQEIQEFVEKAKKDAPDQDTPNES